MTETFRYPLELITLEYPVQHYSKRGYVDMVVSNHTYALRVTGDSMIDAGINKGDLVIVHRQEAVSNGDIVIALIDQEATMKKFMLMGDTVLLISENPKYEPIQMHPKDVVINGKVIGVLKG